MNATTLIRLSKETIFGNTIALFVAQKLPSGSLAVAQNITFQTVEPDQALPPDPLLHLDAGEAQSLMDQLWHLGIRPTEGHGSTGQIAAVEAHRDDLRQMLDKTLTTLCNVVNAPLVASTKP